MSSVEIFTLNVWTTTANIALAQGRAVKTARRPTEGEGDSAVLQYKHLWSCHIR